MLSKCINFQDYCTNGIIDHLIKLKNHEFSFNGVQKILRQISKIRFRCSLLELLKSTLYRDDNEYNDKIKSYDRSIHLYNKSKKKERIIDQPFTSVVDDWRTKLYHIYPSLSSILREVCSNKDIPGYYTISCMDVLSFILRNQELVSKESVIDSIKLMHDLILKMYKEETLYDWRNGKEGRSLERRKMSEVLEGVHKMNSHTQAYFTEMVYDISDQTSPYIENRPILLSLVSAYMSNVNSLLPSLSAHILHSIFSKVLSTDLLFLFNLPTKILTVVCKILEKIMVICQADLCASTHFMQVLISVQTVMNNRQYRDRVEGMFLGGPVSAQYSEDPLIIQPKEVLSIYVNALDPQVADGMIAAYNGLWETMKTKYVYMVSIEELKNILGHINNRLNEIYIELDTNVYTHTGVETQALTKQVDLQDLKFDKITGSKRGLPTTVNSGVSAKDMLKNKIEYLKNYRDIFGEYEYYLELIDCISANLNEKLSVKYNQPLVRDDNNPGPQDDLSLDKVSKKLIFAYNTNGMMAKNSLDSGMLNITAETAEKMMVYIFSFLKDSVYIDYFQSSWVILCNFLSISEERKRESVNSSFLDLLSHINSAYIETGLTKTHIYKCLHYVLDYLTNTMNLAFDPTIDSILIKLIPLLFTNANHSQNTDTVRLLRYLLNKYPQEITANNVCKYYSIFLDPAFDLENDNSVKLYDQFMDICSARTDREGILILLLNTVLSSYSLLYMKMK